MKDIRQIDVFEKRVFVRADLDVPMEGIENVHTKLDNETATRLTNLRETFNYLVRERAKQIVIAGHIGRPSGKEVDKSTKHLIPVLQNILKCEITFNDQIPSSNDQIGDANVVLLENLRFWEGETKNDLEFAKKLAALADIYVNEAFGNSHREHASMVSLPSLLPHVAGLHLAEEVETLTRVLETPARPFVAIVGGAKMETKLPVIDNLAKIAHNVLVGGALPVEIEKTGKKFGENVLIAKLTDDKKDIDIESIHTFVRHIEKARTVVWNGPMGLYEEGFETGTKAVANAILASGAYCVVGGGETTQFLEKHALLSQFSFVSAGGGAMLEFLSGKILPGIAALG